ncbi:acetylornithine deacetylase [Phyllobacterium phragmitis]|uniref:Acetylornithine deacetylase n=1 Tax=Phyllobacterium phragmitis TaxID=2670329 RepID=A0A2S9ISU8_9HYPH|nr:acetylornithine deacetylase [Phyllobacterium phragmitis]PRD43599.1 acetylornithine deacetylase [Phyllobacterium phragmitis]
MHEVEILEKLVSFRSVVGTPNGDIVEWVTSYLRGLGAKVHVLPGPEGDRSNLFATIGPKDRSGYILSGHLDVVSAIEPDWIGDPFRLRSEGNRLHGRGATDMKGFLAAALAAASKVDANSLVKPIHFAFSYDEEATCHGVPHLIERLPELCQPPLGAIIGEPSGMQPILAHKGKAAARITVRGKSGHSSRPDQGLNAIHGATAILVQAVKSSETLSHGPFDATFEPPYSSLQVGTLKGGTALNIIPDICEFQLEARAIAGCDPRSLLSDIRQAADALQAQGYDVEWTETGAYPPLSLLADSALAALVTALSGKAPLAAVSYGTEAGLFQQAGIDSIICGPGNISRAHKPNEYILIEELSACVAMIDALSRHCCG